MTKYKEGEGPAESEVMSVRLSAKIVKKFGLVSRLEGKTIRMLLDEAATEWLDTWKKKNKVTLPQLDD